MEVGSREAECEIWNLEPEIPDSESEIPHSEPPLRLSHDGYGREIYVEREDQNGKPMVWYRRETKGAKIRFTRKNTCTDIERVLVPHHLSNGGFSVGAGVACAADLPPVIVNSTPLPAWAIFMPVELKASTRRR